MTKSLPETQLYNYGQQYGELFHRKSWGFVVAVLFLPRLLVGLGCWLCVGYDWLGTVPMSK